MDPTDRGPYILTRSGKRFHFNDPRPEDVDIEDIAWALSQINRFNGHTCHPYSVAQHSVLVSEMCPYEWAYSGLMHDAAEAYVGDLASPLKAAMRDDDKGWRRIYSTTWAVIVQKFDVPVASTGDLPPQVKEADLRALQIEAHVLLGVEDPANTKGWPAKVPVDVRQLGFVRHPWQPRDARHAFLKRFKALGP